MAPVVKTPDDPRCVAVVQRYGNDSAMYQQMIQCEPKADTPSMVIMMRTYGTDAVRRQLASRMKMAALRMGETTLDEADATIIGEAICDTGDARMLAYDLVLGFFRALETGRYELYSCKPRHVMDAWRKYSAAAHQLQTRLREQAVRERRDREWEAHHKQCITLAEYRRRKGQQC